MMINFKLAKTTDLYSIISSIRISVGLLGVSSTVFRPAYLCNFRERRFERKEWSWNYHNLSSGRWTNYMRVHPMPGRSHKRFSELVGRPIVIDTKSGTENPHKYSEKC